MEHRIVNGLHSGDQKINRKYNTRKNKRVYRTRVQRPRDTKLMVE